MGNWGKKSISRNIHIKISTPPKKHGISWVRPYGNAASTIAVGSWTPGVGPPESSESCAAALKTASICIFPPNSPLSWAAPGRNTRLKLTGSSSFRIFFHFRIFFRLAVLCCVACVAAVAVWCVWCCERPVHIFCASSRASGSFPRNHFT